MAPGSALVSGLAANVVLVAANGLLTARTMGFECSSAPYYLRLSNEHVESRSVSLVILLCAGSVYGSWTWVQVWVQAWDLEVGWTWYQQAGCCADSALMSGIWQEVRGHVARYDARMSCKTKEGMALIVK